MIKRDVFKKVGGFSQEYFMYAEDVDLCYKVFRAGYQNYYVGSATVIHYGGGSSVPHAAITMKWRSMVRYFVRNHGRAYSVVFRGVMALIALVRLAVISVRALFSLARGHKSVPELAKWRIILKTLLHPRVACDPRSGAPV